MPVKNLFDRRFEMQFTPTQWRVMVAAHMTGSASNADIDSRRTKSRTISELQGRGYLASQHIDGSIPLTGAGEDAFWKQPRRAA